MASCILSPYGKNDCTDCNNELFRCSLGNEVLGKVVRDEIAGKYPTPNFSCYACDNTGPYAVPTKTGLMGTPGFTATSECAGAYKCTNGAPVWDAKSTDQTHRTVAGTYCYTCDGTKPDPTMVADGTYGTTTNSSRCDGSYTCTNNVNGTSLVWNPLIANGFYASDTNPQCYACNNSQATPVAQSTYNYDLKDTWKRLNEKCSGSYVCDETATGGVKWDATSQELYNDDSVKRKCYACNPTGPGLQFTNVNGTKYATDTCPGNYVCDINSTLNTKRTWDPNASTTYNENQLVNCFKCTGSSQTPVFTSTGDGTIASSDVNCPGSYYCNNGTTEWNSQSGGKATAAEQKCYTCTNVIGPTPLPVPGLNTGGDKTASDICQGSYVCDTNGTLVWSPSITTGSPTNNAYCYTCEGATSATPLKAAPNTFFSSGVTKDSTCAGANVCIPGTIQIGTTGYVEKCENENTSIAACANGKLIIDYAEYGSACGTTADCKGVNVTVAVQKLVDSSATKSLAITSLQYNTIFGFDPCIGTLKKFKVYYHCETNTSTWSATASSANAEKCYVCDGTSENPRPSTSADLPASLLYGSSNEYCPGNYECNAAGQITWNPNLVRAVNTNPTVPASCGSTWKQSCFNTYVKRFNQYVAVPKLWSGELGEATVSEHRFGTSDPVIIDTFYAKQKQNWPTLLGKVIQIRRFAGTSTTIIHTGMPGNVRSLYTFKLTNSTKDTDYYESEQYTLNNKEFVPQFTVLVYKDPTLNSTLYMANVTGYVVVQTSVPTTAANVELNLDTFQVKAVNMTVSIQDGKTSLINTNQDRTAASDIEQNIQMYLTFYDVGTCDQTGSYGKLCINSNTNTDYFRCTDYKQFYKNETTQNYYCDVNIKQVPAFPDTHPLKTDSWSYRDESIGNEHMFFRFNFENSDSTSEGFTDATLVNAPHYLNNKWGLQNVKTVNVLPYIYIICQFKSPAHTVNTGCCNLVIRQNTTTNVIDYRMIFGWKQLSTDPSYICNQTAWFTSFEFISIILTQPRLLVSLAPETYDLPTQATYSPEIKQITRLPVLVPSPTCLFTITSPLNNNNVEMAWTVDSTKSIDIYNHDSQKQFVPAESYNMLSTYPYNTSVNLYWDNSAPANVNNIFGMQSVVRFVEGDYFYTVVQFQSPVFKQSDSLTYNFIVRQLKNVRTPAQTTANNYIVGSYDYKFLGLWKKYTKGQTTSCPSTLNCSSRLFESPYIIGSIILFSMRQGEYLILDDIFFTFTNTNQQCFDGVLPPNAHSISQVTPNSPTSACTGYTMQMEISKNTTTVLNPLNKSLISLDAISQQDPNFLTRKYKAFWKYGIRETVGTLTQLTQTYPYGKMMFDGSFSNEMYFIPSATIVGADSSGYYWFDSTLKVKSMHYDYVNGAALSNPTNPVDVVAVQLGIKYDVLSYSYSVKVRVRANWGSSTLATYYGCSGCHYNANGGKDVGLFSTDLAVTGVVSPYTWENPKPISVTDLTKIKIPNLSFPRNATTVGAFLIS